MRNKTPRLILFLAITTLSLSMIHSGLAGNDKLPIYNETLQYNVRWMGMTVGRVKMVTQQDSGKGLLKSYAEVHSFDYLKKIYYVGGYFGSHWNYRRRTPSYAYEEVFQGKKYHKRSFWFSGNSVSVERIRKTFDEYSLPHKKPVNEKNDSRKVYAPGYQDLLGAFYYMRTSGHSPKIGEVMRIKILPSGEKRELIVKVIDRDTRKVPGLGNKKLFKVRTAIHNPAKKDGDQGGNIFFDTKSNIDMWITDDANFLPVEMSTKVDYLGTVYILLDKYNQN